MRNHVHSFMPNTSQKRAYKNDHNFIFDVKVKAKRPKTARVLSYSTSGFWTMMYTLVTGRVLSMFGYLCQ